MARGNTTCIGCIGKHILVLFFCAYLDMVSMAIGERRSASDDLTSQIQTYEQLMLECRRQQQLLTGQSARDTTQITESYAVRELDTEEFSRLRKALYMKRANYYSRQLQTTVEKLKTEFNQCAAAVQSIRTAQQEIQNKEEVATQLLEDIELAAANLRACIDEGGDTYVDLPTLTSYIDNGGFIPVVVQLPTPTTPRPTKIQQIDYSIYHAPSPPTYRVYGYGRRAINDADWDQVLAQRTQWKAFAMQAVIKCWASIGRLPDGSLPAPPTTTTTTTTTITTTTIPAPTVAAPSLPSVQTPAPPPPAPPLQETTSASPVNHSTSTVAYTVSTNGPGLTTAFAPMMTTIPC